MWVGMPLAIIQDGTIHTLVFVLVQINYVARIADLFIRTWLNLEMFHKQIFARTTTHYVSNLT